MQIILRTSRRSTYWSKLLGSPLCLLEAEVGAKIITSLSTLCREVISQGLANCLKLIKTQTQRSLWLSEINKQTTQIIILMRKTTLLWALTSYLRHRRTSIRTWCLQTISAISNSLLKKIWLFIWDLPFAQVATLLPQMPLSRTDWSNFQLISKRDSQIRTRSQKEERECPLPRDIKEESPITIRMSWCLLIQICRQGLITHRIVMFSNYQLMHRPLCINRLKRPAPLTLPSLPRILESSTSW